MARTVSNYVHNIVITKGVPPLYSKETFHLEQGIDSD